MKNNCFLLSDESPSFSLLGRSLSSSQGTSPLSAESNTRPAQELLFQAHLLASQQTTRAIIRSNVDQSAEEDLRDLWSKCPIEYRWHAWPSLSPSEAHHHHQHHPHQLGALEDSRQEFRSADKFDLETDTKRADVDRNSRVRITCPGERTAFRRYRSGLPRSLPDSRLLVTTTEAPFWGETTIGGSDDTFPTSGTADHVTDHRLLLRSESLPDEFYQRAYLESRSSTGGVLLPYRRDSTRQVTMRYCEPSAVSGWISVDSKRHCSPKRDKAIGEVWRPY